MVNGEEDARAFFDAIRAEVAVGGSLCRVEGVEMC